MDTYKSFRRHRQSRKGGGVKLHVPVGKDRGESQQGGHHGGESCYIPFNQDEQTEEAFYKQLAEVS